MDRVSRVVRDRVKAEVGEAKSEATSRVRVLQEPLPTTQIRTLTCRQ